MLRRLKIKIENKTNTMIQFTFAFLHFCVFQLVLDNILTPRLIVKINVLIHNNQIMYSTRQSDNRVLLIMIGVKSILLKKLESKYKPQLHKNHAISQFNFLVFLKNELIDKCKMTSFYLITHKVSYLKI